MKYFLYTHFQIENYTYYLSKCVCAIVLIARKSRNNNRKIGLSKEVLKES